jgi:hypothetical protein
VSYPPSSQLRETPLRLPPRVGLGGGVGRDFLAFAAGIVEIAPRAAINVISMSPPRLDFH